VQSPFHARPLKYFLGLIALLALAGCVRPRPATVPLRTVSYPGSGKPRTLVVLLPGRRDRPEDFGRERFPEIAARAGARVDMIAVDAHMAYYLNRTVVDRLREDVNGLVLFAPYLGEDPVIREVSAADGIRGWRPPEPLAPDDYQRRVWAWLKGYERGPEGRLPLYLGWGRSDGFARANGLAAQALPPERVFTAPGGHGWKAWRSLWEQFVRTGALSR